MTTKRLLMFSLGTAVLTLLVYLLSGGTEKAPRHEKDYQKAWCKTGVIEAIMPDKTRCDCLTDTNAIEFDFGKKWYEAIGQSLYYALQTGKKAGIVLIIKKPKDYKYWVRLNSTIAYHQLKIDTWVIESYKAD